MSAEKYGEKELSKEKLKRKPDAEKVGQTIEKGKIRTALDNLKHLVETGGIHTSLHALKKSIIFSDKEIKTISTTPESKKALAQLEEVDHFEHIDELLPKELRVTKNEYLQALKDPQTKAVVLEKFDKSLDVVYRNFRGTSFFKSSPITRNSRLANNPLIALQGTFIDLKRTLDS